MVGEMENLTEAEKLAIHRDVLIERRDAWLDRATKAEEALEEARRDLAWFVGIRRDLVDSLAYVDEATDPRTLAARVVAALKGDAAWESVEVE